MEYEETNAGANPLGQKSVKTLFIIYTVMGFIGMIPQMFQIFLDGFFVGNGVGVNGLATMSVVGSLLTLTSALSSLWGFGSATMIGLELGKGEITRARKINGQFFWHAFITSVLIAIFVLLNLDNVVRWLGATGSVIESSKIYIRIFMIGFPFTAVGPAIYYTCRADGQTLLPTLAMGIPGFISPIVEYFLIMKMHIGIAGSAIAFIVTLCPSFLLLLYFVFGKTQLKIKLSDIKPDFKIIKNINVIGFCQAATSIAISFVTILINNLLGRYGSKLDSAAFGITNSYFLYLLVLLMLCCNAGIQPIASFNYGAKFYKRVNQLLKSAIAYTIILFALIVLAIFIFANQVIGIFASDNANLIQVTNHVLKYFLITFPLGGTSLLVSSYFQSVEQVGKANFHALTRSLIFMIPLLLILPNFLGVTGIWLSQTSSDILAFATAMIFVYNESKRLNGLYA